MADEQLKVGITGDASGLEKASHDAAEALNKIGKSATQATTQLAAIPKVSQQVASSSAQMARTAATAGGAVQKTTKDFTGLSRVIQDLPYGFNAISNNLTQLLPAAGAAGLAFSAIVSALTVAQIGFGAWTRGLGGSKQALDDQVKKLHEARQALDTYVESLGVVTQARVKGLQGAQEELVNLRTLYEATQNVNIPLSERKKLVDELQEQYPKYFGNIKDEIILAGGAKTAYDKLTTAILASAKARAANEILVDINKQVIALDQKISENSATQIKQQQNLNSKLAGQNKLVTATTDEFGNVVSTIKESDVAQSQLNSTTKAGNDLLKQKNDLLGQAKQLSKFVQTTVEQNPGGLTDPGGNVPKVQTTKVKTEFLFDFLPFDPSGKLKPEQRAEVLNAIDKFSKEFGGILKGIDFSRQAKTDDDKIKLALQFDAKLKAGNVEFDTKALTDSINKSLKPEDLLPADSLQALSAGVVDRFIKGFQIESERVKNLNPFNLPVAFNLTTDLPAQIDLFKTKIKQLGAILPETIQANNIFGKPVEVTLDDLIDTSKVANNDALKALQDAFNKIIGGIKSKQEQLNEALNDFAKSVSVEGISSIGEAIGAALTGGDIGNVFKQFESFLGGAVQGLGKQIIALNVAALAVKRSLSLTFANPAVGIAAGAGLVAIGAALKRLAGGGIKGFAKGGFVPGQGNGDTVPAMLTPGEFVVTKDKAPMIAAFLKALGNGIKLPRISNSIQHFAEGGFVQNNRPSLNTVSNKITNNVIQFPNYLPVIDWSFDRMRVMYKRADKDKNIFGG